MPFTFRVFGAVGQGGFGACRRHDVGWHAWRLAPNLPQSASRRYLTNAGQGLEPEWSYSEERDCSEGSECAGTGFFVR